MRRENRPSRTTDTETNTETKRQRIYMHRTRTHFTGQLAGFIHVFRMLHDEMRPDSPKSMYPPDMAMLDADDEDQLLSRSMFQVFRYIGPTVIIVTARVLLRWKVRHIDP